MKLGSGQWLSDTYRRSLTEFKLPNIDMNKKQFGELVRALRREHLDEDLHGWTRQKLSMEIEQATGKPFKLDTLGKIERGERQYLSAEELTALADGLQLTSVERQGFFYASSGLNDAEVGRQVEEAEQFLTDLLTGLNGVRLPFFVVDSYGDVVAMNGMVLSVLQLPSELIARAREHPIGFNILRIIFDPDMGFRDLVGRVSWEEIATHNILLFRGNSIAQRATPYFQHVLRNLRRMGSFRWRWEEIHWQESDYTGAGLPYQFNHPKLGTVQYTAVESRIVTGQGMLMTVIYMPLDAQTTTTFEALAQQPELLAQQQLGNWPQKAL